LSILHRLSDIVGVNELWLHTVPDAGVLQCLLRRESVRRVIGIGDRNALYFRPRQVGDTILQVVRYKN